MRIDQRLLSLLALLTGFFLIATGLFFLIFPNIQLDLQTIGTILAVSGFIMLLTFFLLSRRRYLLLKMGGVAIHEKVLGHFAKEVLEDLFPDQSVHCDVIIHKKRKVEILATIPYLSEESRTKKLEQIETELSATLMKHCGCEGSFIFNVSFS